MIAPRQPINQATRGFPETQSGVNTSEMNEDGISS